MEAALELMDRFQGLPVLCAGDAMVDLYIHGQAHRISPEAPVPVVKVARRLLVPGGAGNVVKNLGALGAAPRTVCLTGDDAWADELKRLFVAAGLGEPVFIREASRPTSVKTRIIAGIQQVVRFDEEDDRPLCGEKAEEFLTAVRAALPGVRAVVLSDYGKGCLTDELLRAILDSARDAGLPVVGDPKGRDYGRYRGAALVTPNRLELAEAVGRRLVTAGELERAGRELMAACGLANLLITRSEDGMMLLEGGQDEPVILPSQAREVFDVSGAGDTVAAVMAAALAVGAPLAVGARLANLAAGVVVGKVGTATAAPGEIRAWAEDGAPSPGGF
jgi:D-beta-D-heptose 7-phosphate kinase/D-beta-D-heptose 1-phosphate adenosyltransferase